VIHDARGGPINGAPFRGARPPTSEKKGVVNSAIAFAAACGDLDRVHSYPTDYALYEECGTRWSRSCGEVDAGAISDEIAAGPAAGKRDNGRRARSSLLCTGASPAFSAPQVARPRPRVAPRG